MSASTPGQTEDAAALIQNTDAETKGDTLTLRCLSHEGFDPAERAVAKSGRTRNHGKPRHRSHLW